MHLTVISDDLTGAADSGGYFTDRGCQLNIFTGDKFRFEQQGKEILSYNLSSRNVAGTVAKQRHKVLCQQLADGEHPDTVYMKKIGTGFRGNDSWELAGLLAARPDYCCFVVDHAPDLGTFTLYGEQYCEGQILHKSLYSRDPIFPPTKAYIPELLAEHIDFPIGTVDIDAVKGGHIAERTSACIASGCRIIVFDAVTKADTLTILSELVPRYSKVFWTGSLGLADGLAEYFYGQPVVTPVRRRDIRSLVFCGSAYDTAKRQIDHSARQNLSVVKLSIDAVIAGRRTEILQKTIQQALGENKRGNVVIMPHAEDCSYKPGTSAIIMQCMEELASVLTAQAVFDRLVVIGGETAQAVFRAAGIQELALTGKLEAGVAEGVICGGPLHNKEFALKGGSVGSDEALDKMMCRFGGGKEAGW